MESFSSSCHKTWERTALDGFVVLLPGKTWWSIGPSGQRLYGNYFQFSERDWEHYQTTLLCAQDGAPGKAKKVKLIDLMVSDVWKSFANANEREIEMKGGKCHQP